MEHFASGSKRNYYGKGDVIVYRLDRQRGTVFGANVKMLLYGDAFWNTYTTGDNTGLVATDSMKNFIQRETLNFPGDGFEEYAEFLATKFLAKYPQAEGIQLSVREIPYAGAVAFSPAGPECATVRLEINRAGAVEFTGGLAGFRLLRLGGSAFHGFVRDEYTTLPDLLDRPLHMWLDLEWTYADASAARTDGALTREVARRVHETFAAFESGSIQQVIYRMGQGILAAHPGVAEVWLEANNRTWDTITEQDGRGVYTDARPPYGCLGLRLKR